MYFRMESKDFEINLCGLCWICACVCQTQLSLVSTISCISFSIEYWYQLAACLIENAIWNNVLLLTTYIYIINWKMFVRIQMKWMTLCTFL